MGTRVADVIYVPGQNGTEIQAATFQSTSDADVPDSTCSFTRLDPKATGRFANTLPLLGTWTVDWAQGGSLANLPFNFSGLQAIKVSFPGVSTWCIVPHQQTKKHSGEIGVEAPSQLHLARGPSHCSTI